MTSESKQPKTTLAKWVVRTDVTLDSTIACLDLPNAIELLKYVHPTLRNQLRNQVAGDTSFENYGTDLGAMDPQF